MHLDLVRPGWNPVVDSGINVQLSLSLLPAISQQSIDIPTNSNEENNGTLVLNVPTIIVGINTMVDDYSTNISILYESKKVLISEYHHRQSMMLDDLE